MKKKLIKLSLFTTLLLGLASCGEKDKDNGMRGCCPDPSYNGSSSTTKEPYVYTDDYSPSTDESDRETGDSDYRPEEYKTDVEKEIPDDEAPEKMDLENHKKIKAGLLTAKALFDNEDENYEYFSKLCNDFQFCKENRLESFASFESDYDLHEERIKVTVEGTPYAKVSLLNKDNNVLWTSITDPNGVCYLFSKAEGTKIEVSFNNETKQYDVADNLVVTDFENTVKRDTIQVLFTLDTTGSMSDEISFLQAELVDVINQIKNRTNSNLEVGLITYKDTTDEYVTRKFEFTNDINSIAEEVKKETASGGGDYPEAVEKAFDVANEFDWKEDATKVMVHIADAPCHNSAVGQWFKDIKDFSNKGIRVLSVASSGIDLFAEYLMRMQALQTNGCYAYLTDDSGIGDSHLEAETISEEIVEYLNGLLVRVIEGFHTGDFGTPVAYYKYEYRELLDVNPNIDLSASTQGYLAHKYVAQFGVGEISERAYIKYAFSCKACVAFYIEDSFTEREEISTVETVENVTFIYPNTSERILIFLGDRFITLTEAFANGVISKENLESCRSYFSTIPAFC